MMSKRNITIGLSLFISFVFIQSLFFKFTGAEDTINIFGTLDLWASETFGIDGLFVPPGPFNAYVIGTAELIASIGLLIGVFAQKAKLIPLAGLLSLGIMTGAIFFHLFTPLGIVVNNDGGALFSMAAGVWLSSLALIVMYKDVLLPTT